MNDFVEQCRREWKRLGVPDAVADEMAADLAADLEEAEAEGASAEEVLGTGASDPRSFAAAWAAERAVIPPPRWTDRAPGRVLLLAAIAALTVVTAIGAALVVFASPDASTPEAAFRVIRPPANTPIRVRVDPPSVAGGAVWVARDGIAVPYAGERPGRRDPSGRLDPADRRHRRNDPLDVVPALVVPRAAVA